MIISPSVGAITVTATEDQTLATTSGTTISSALTPPWTPIC